MVPTPNELVEFFGEEKISASAFFYLHSPKICLSINNRNRLKFTVVILWDCAKGRFFKENRMQSAGSRRLQDLTPSL
jgi:hypothetical protein